MGERRWLFALKHILSFSTPFPFLLQKRKRCRAAKGKERVGKPSTWFPHTPSIGQSLALNLRRMEFGESTIEYAVRRSLLHSVSAGAAKTPYPQSPSSSPKGNRFTGLPFGFYIPAVADSLPLHKGAFGRTELSAPTNCIRKMLRPDRIRPGGAGAGGLRGRRRWSRAEARSARPWSAASWRRCPARRGQNNSAAG